jgi:hypothetical protein
MVVSVIDAVITYQGPLYYVFLGGRCLTTGVRNNLQTTKLCFLFKRRILRHARFYVLSAVSMRCSVFWDITWLKRSTRRYVPEDRIPQYWCSRMVSRTSRQQAEFWLLHSTLKLETVCCSETSMWTSAVLHGSISPKVTLCMRMLSATRHSKSNLLPPPFSPLRVMKMWFSFVSVS